MASPEASSSYFIKCELAHRTTRSGASYLSESRHGLTGDDFITAEARDEAQRLVLVLPSLQLTQDQRSEYLHFLQEAREDEHINRRLLKDTAISYCLYLQPIQITANILSTAALFQTLKVFQYVEFKDVQTTV